jgi:hypothetical protein
VDEASTVAVKDNIVLNMKDYRIMVSLNTKELT